MEISEFIKSYTNHPILFIGTGFSIRYLDNAYSWDELLKHITTIITNDSKSYLDLKSKYFSNGIVSYDSLATEIEIMFEEYVKHNTTDDSLKAVNDIFYENMEKNIKISRLKIYISLILSELSYKQNMQEELTELIKTRKNIGSIITTNYDKLVEDIFEFNPLIGNDILLSNPYGSVYKIHGCVSKTQDIIITQDDYIRFEQKHELIRAQLLSLFTHNPIIFIGYSVSDVNIRKLLKTIFTYVEPNTELASKIKSNFLLIEYEQGSTNTTINDYDVLLDNDVTIRINKLKTDNYLSVYKELSNLRLAVSAMDIRKVQSIVNEIYSGGEINVKIVDDIETLRNEDKVLAIGSKQRIRYEYQRPHEMIQNYFKIIEEDNSQLLAIIDKHTISENQFFPVFGFSTINSEIKSVERLKRIQFKKLVSVLHSPNCKNDYSTLEEIFDTNNVALSNQPNHLVYSLLSGKINFESVEDYLKQIPNEEKRDTKYRKILCSFDFIKYATTEEKSQILRHL